MKVYQIRTEVNANGGVHVFRMLDTETMERRIKYVTYQKMVRKRTVQRTKAEYEAAVQEAIAAIEAAGYQLVDTIDKHEYDPDIKMGFRAY